MPHTWEWRRRGEERWGQGGGGVEVEDICTYGCEKGLQVCLSVCLSVCVTTVSVTNYTRSNKVWSIRHK